MVGVWVHAKLAEKDTRCLRFLRNLSAHRQPPLQQSSSVEALHLPADEDSLRNGDSGFVCSNERPPEIHHSNGEFETGGSDGKHKAVGSGRELDFGCDHGSHETLHSNGSHKTLRGGSGMHGTLHSNGNLETLSGRIPSDEVIQTLCGEGELEMALRMLSHMQTIPLFNTYLSLLQACTKQNSLAQVKHVHAHLANHCLHITTFLGGYVVNALAKCGGLKEALSLFRTLPHRTVHSYSCLISILADRREGRTALQMWVRMQEEGIEPNQYTYVGLLKACGTIPDLKEGMKLHEEVRMKGLGGDFFVGSTLVSMYSRCGCIHEAENVFSELSKPNVAVWNAMITAYIEHKEGEKALQVYRQMLEHGLDRDQGTFVLALQACSILAEKMQGFVRDGKLIKTGILRIGQALHADARQSGFAFDVVVTSALVTMYGKCGAFTDAENVFFRLPKRDTVLWNAMLSAYVDAGEGRKSLRLYLHMQEEGIIPDGQTVTIALSACRTIVEKEETVVLKQQGTKLLPVSIVRALEKDARSNNIAIDDVFCDVLMFVYGKCGAKAKAERIFSRLPYRSTVSWNAILSVYIKHRNGDKALQAYNRLQEELATPDDVSLIYGLQACIETGCLETCRVIHFTLASAHLELDTLLSTALLHTYGSCASMKDGESIFNEILNPDMLPWDACITGYTQGGNFTHTLEMLDKMRMEHVDPDGIVFTLALSACNHAGLVQEGINYFNLMMTDYGFSPDIRHYGTLIDLFGRAGDFSRVKAILKKMPMQPDRAIWSCLLNASCIHGDTDLDNWDFYRQKFAKGAVFLINKGKKTLSK